MSGVQTFDFTLDLAQALLWQSNEAVRLQSLILSKQAWYDENQTQFWEDWVRDVFDLRTANDFGLSVWAHILNVPLVATEEATGTEAVFGFDEYNLNFDNGTFGRDIDGVVGLNTEQKRLVLRLRYFQLTTRGAVTEINAFLASLRDTIGAVYVLDGLNMNASYFFAVAPPSSISYVFEKFDLLPRPAGVKVITAGEVGSSFGFEPYFLNFDNGNFYGA